MDAFQKRKWYFIQGKKEYSLKAITGEKETFARKDVECDEELYCGRHLMLSTAKDQNGLCNYQQKYHIHKKNITTNDNNSTTTK